MTIRTFVSSRKIQILCLLVLLILAIVAGFYSLFSKSDQLLVLNVIPIDNAQSVGIYPTISVRFSRPLTADEQNNLTLESTPKIQGTISWESAQQLYLNVEQPLQQSEIYTLSVITESLRYSWQFTTVSRNNVSFEDQVKVQSQSDQSYGEYIERIYDTYPWYNKLPLQTETYFVYFSTERKRFIAKLYADTTSQQSFPAQMASLKTEVLQRLRELGIDSDNYEIEWQENQTNNNTKP